MKKKAISLLLSLLLVLTMLAPLGVVSFACWPHVYDDGVVATEPSCGSTGVLTYTCTLCGDSFDVTLPASGEHVYDEPVITTEPTCGTPGVLTYTCTVCGDVYNEPRRLHLHLRNLRFHQRRWNALLSRTDVR